MHIVLRSLFIVIFGISLPTHLQAGPIAIDLKLHKSAIVSGEPLYIIAYVKNIGATPIGIGYGNSPSYAIGKGCGNVMMAKEGASYSRWSDNMRVIDKVSPQSLAPLQILTNSYVICANDAGDGCISPAFINPGVYQIKLEYLLSSRDIAVSEPVKVEVKAPLDNDESVWNSALSNRLFWLLMQAPWEVDAGTGKVPGLAEKLPNVKGSVYWQYLALGIGRSLSYQGRRDEAQKFFNLAKEAADNEFVRHAADKYGQVR